MGCIKTRYIISESTPNATHPTAAPVIPGFEVSAGVVGLTPRLLWRADPAYENPLSSETACVFWRVNIPVLTLRACEKRCFAVFAIRELWFLNALMVLGSEVLQSKEGRRERKEIYGWLGYK